MTIYVLMENDFASGAYDDLDLAIEQRKIREAHWLAKAKENGRLKTDVRVHIRQFELNAEAK